MGAYCNHTDSAGYGGCTNKDKGTSDHKVTLTSLVGAHFRVTTAACQGREGGRQYLQKKQDCASIIDSLLSCCHSSIRVCTYIVSFRFLVIERGVAK